MKYQDELVNVWVIELNGYSEGIINLFLELRREDAKEILDNITEYQNEAQKKTKKTK